MIAAADSLRVLVVDDSPTASLFLKAKLESLSEGIVNADIDVVVSGEDALKLCGESPFDLLVLDVVLPGIDGFGVCREIKKNGHSRVAFLTALDDAESDEKARAAGSDHYIVKPASDEELKEVLKIAAIKCNRGYVING